MTTTRCADLTLLKIFVFGRIDVVPTVGFMIGAGSFDVMCALRFMVGTRCDRVGAIRLTAGWCHMLSDGRWSRFTVGKDVVFVRSSTIDCCKVMIQMWSKKKNRFDLERLFVPRSSVLRASD
jgi:roadblock/LC7 domain-containing protein